MGHALMENRNGLLVDACLTQADGHAERVAVLHMIEPRADRGQAITLGADKAYDAEDYICRLLGFPHPLFTVAAPPLMALQVAGVFSFEQEE
jgi:hypothetical protein